jgi:hypothetical protein
MGSPPLTNTAKHSAEPRSEMSRPRISLRQSSWTQQGRTRCSIADSHARETMTWEESCPHAGPSLLHLSAVACVDDQDPDAVSRSSPAVPWKRTWPWAICTSIVSVTAALLVLRYFYSTVQYSTGLATDRRASTLSPDPLQPSAYNTFQRKSLLPAGPAVPHGLVELLLAAHQAELTLLTRFTAQNIPIHRAVPAPAQCARRPVELSPFGRTWLLHSSAGCSALQHQPPWYTLQENVCLSSALCPPSLPHLQPWPPPIEWTSPPRLRTKCCAEPRSPKSDPLQASCPLRHCVLTMHL